MTRAEKQEELKRLWHDMQITEHGVTDRFIGWQGQVVAVLGYNPGLQAEFKETVKSVPESGYYEWRQGGAKAHREICNLLSQAINELGLQEETPLTPVLTDEHGLLWFITHCTWRTRWALIGLALPLTALLAGVFFAGFKVGMLNEARDLYIHFMNPSSIQPISSPTPPQPNK
jgi:hypothetical protein